MPIRSQPASEGADSGAQRVDAVEQADVGGDGLERAGDRPGEKRQRQAHEERRRQQGQEGQGSDEVDPARKGDQLAEEKIIEERRAQGREDRDPDLAEREGSDRTAPGETVGKRGSPETAEAKPEQEGADHDRCRDRVGPAEQAEKALPCGLVDKRREARDEEQAVEQRPGEEVIGPVRSGETCV